MKRKLFGYQISLSKDAEVKPSFSQEDFHEMNGVTLRYIRQLPKGEIERRISEISVASLDNKTDLNIAKQLLSENGIVIVPGFLDINRLSGAVSEIERGVSGLSFSDDFENESVRVQVRDRQLDTYQKLAEYNKPVVTVRQGADQGMLDVFNVDLFCGNQRGDLREKFENKQLLELVTSNGETLQAKNLNMYVNAGIEKTRGFHVDSFGTNLKSFVYLSDVLSLEDGPYCFVRKTHRENAMHKANLAISKGSKALTEAPFVDVLQIVPVLAPAGSLIISDQSGVHRGFPQSASGKRKVLVMRYL